MTANNLQYSTETYTSTETKLSAHTVIGGDLNANFNAMETKQSVTELNNLLRQFNLIYTNCEPTRGKARLDNVFTNIDRACLFTDVVAFPFLDHDSTYLKIRDLKLDYSVPKFKFVTTLDQFRQWINK